MELSLSQAAAPKVGSKRKADTAFKTSSKKRKFFRRTRKLISKRDPFPRIMRNVIMRYQDTPGYTMSWPGGVSYYNAFHMYPTSLYDFDYSGVIGNKQPLYFDTLCTSTGPYGNFRVKSWKTTVTVVNLSSVPVVVFLGQASLTGGTAELDTPTEVQNFPGVKKEFLTEKGGEKCIAKLTIYGELSKLATTAKDADWTGGYAANPAKNVTISALVQSMDGSSAGSCLISVNHEAVADFFNQDAYIS